MKKKIIKKTAAFFLSGMIAAAGTGFSAVEYFGADAAANKSRVSVHDPSIIKDNGTYYVFGSHIDAAKTSDLQNWKTFTNGYARTNNVEFGNLSQNLQKAFAWAGEDLGDCVGGFAVWAPDVVWNPDYKNADGSKGAYLMYFCTSSTWNTSVIGYAAAKNIEGPYQFVDTLIYSGFTEKDSYAKSSTKNVNRKYTSTNIDELMGSGEVSYNSGWFASDGYNYREYPNAIDPTIYYDTNGKMYMVYGSWSGGIFTLEIDKTTGKCIHPKSGKTSDGRLVDSYFGTKLAGGYHKSGEGPFIEYNADTGYYYLWETYGGLLSDGGYNMRVYRSTSPTGPFTDPSGKSGIMTASSKLDSAGLKVMGNYKFSSLDKAYMACGHNSVLKDDDGQWYLFYHARFDDGSEYHEVRVHKMFFNEEGWPVVTPFEYGGDSIAEKGYDESDIVGEYEYINHGNATDGVIINSSKINLNADGTVSGAVSGSWSQSADSAAATITIGNQSYSGYFIAAENEKGLKVMSFTAVGNNNQTIWGAKNTAYTGTERKGIADFSDKNNQLTFAPDTMGESSKSVKIGDTDLLSGVSYFITNKNSNMAVDLTKGAKDEKTNIQQWQQNGLWAQQWRIIAEDDGYCRIVSVGDESMCIAVAENSASDAVNVELQKYTGADNQLFKLVKEGTYYGIVSKCSGGKDGLDVFEWSKENGGNINQYAYKSYDCQLWKISPVYPTVNEGTYYIKNINSGMYLREEDNGKVYGNLVQSTTPQKWRVFGDAETGYRISDPATGKDILVGELSAENGINIGTGSLDTIDSPLEKYRIICNKDGSYAILTATSDYTAAFDVFEISKSEGANINQWEYWGGEGQKFVFEPVNSDPPVTTTAVPKTTTTTTTTATTTTTEPVKVKGDVNGDKTFSVADAALFQKYFLGTDELVDWEAGDLNGDGAVDIFDFAEMRKYF